MNSSSPESALPPERPGAPAPESLLQRRAAISGALGQAPWRTSVPWSEDRLGGVRVVRFHPAGEPKATLLHFHGGGFRMGAPEMVGGFASALAASTGIEVIAVAYRLAPEHPFPAGVADARAVLAALQAQGVQRILVSGDSAGGGIAASLAALAPSMSVRLAGLMLFSPWLDLMVDAPSYQSKGEADKLFSEASAKEAAELYLQGASARHPLASPLHGPVAGFPTTFINVSEDEVLLDDSLRLADALRAAGVEVSVLSTPNMEHVAVTRDRSLHGAAEAFAAVEAFIPRVLARTPG
jgi:monoterpene epsilon-lactone hydrolase